MDKRETLRRLMLLGSALCLVAATTSAHLADGQLSSSAATTILTCSSVAANRCLVKTIRICNTSGSVAYTFNLFQKTGSSTARRLTGKDTEIPPAGCWTDDSFHVLSAADVLQGDASVNNVLDYDVDGGVE